MDFPCPKIVHSTNNMATWQRRKNLHKLKNLQYLNLAVNNIETIENLERCESLEKLDLTLNFIGDLESVVSLQRNPNLRHLYLTGNPCCDYEGYRQYVVAKLPQLETLDQVEITRSEKIKSPQNFEFVERRIRRAQREYRAFRQEQKDRVEQSGTSELSDEEFWQSPSEHCPETREEMSRRSRKNKENNETKTEKKPVRFFNKEGRPLNINQARIPFTFNDESPEKFVLDIQIYKYLDTNLIEVDLQPIYVRIKIKDKIFQMVFSEEICTDKSTAQRSQVTGHLVLEMPKMNYKSLLTRKNKTKSQAVDGKRNEVFEVNSANKITVSQIVENNDKFSTTGIPLLEYA